MMRQTGGCAVGEISTRSRFLSRAIFSASKGGITPICSPSSPITRTSRARMRSFMRIKRLSIPSSVCLSYRLNLTGKMLTKYSMVLPRVPLAHVLASCPHLSKAASIAGLHPVVPPSFVRGPPIPHCPEVLAMRRSASILFLSSVVLTSVVLTSMFLISRAACSETPADSPKPVITSPIDESQLVTLTGNTTSAALRVQNDRGPVADNLIFDHLLLTLKRAPETEARLEKLIDAMHKQDSPEFQRWLELHGFSVNRVYQNGFVIDFAGTAAQIREAFHTEIHNLVLPNGEKHIANMSDPQIPAALAPAVEGVASLHDFFPRPHAIQLGPVSYDAATQKWHPHFNVKYQGQTFHTVSPYDFDTIYNVLPLWNRGFTGKGVTIALVEDSNLAHESDWRQFRYTFDLNGFKDGSFKQIYPNCTNPGQNGDEIEAALDVEWASVAAPDANIELSACAPSRSVSGLDLAILNLLELEPPDIISDSYGLCETITGQTEIALENRAAQTATALGVTFFIAQGDTGADECSPVEGFTSHYGINSGDNTASAYAVDVGGTDFMAQYNQDVNGIPLSDYWSAKNNPQTKASALSYIPEIPWNDGCTSQLIYSDPAL